MSSHQFCGAILPLQQNRSFALQDPTELFEAFDAMAEDPDLKLIRQRYPTLLDMVLTLANPYSQPQLERLSNFVSTYFRIPRSANGLEALITLEDCHPLHNFAEWNMCRLEGPQQDLVQLTPERYDEMTQYLGPELKCYLLWFNSD